jgi:transposase InsO family protein
MMRPADSSRLGRRALDQRGDRYPSRRPGVRFITDELARQGVKAGENRVARLCSQERIWSAFTKKRGLSRKQGPAVHDDLVERTYHRRRRQRGLGRLTPIEFEKTLSSLPKTA